MSKLNLFLLIILFSAKFSLGQKSIDINPSSGFQGQYLSISITGVKTSFGAGSNTLQFFKQGTQTNTISVYNLAVLSQTTILANLFIQGLAPTGSYTYQLSNPIDGVVNGLNPFVVRPDTATPKLLSISPNVMEPGSYLNILVTGENTHFTQGSNILSAVFTLNGSPCLLFANKFKVIDDTHAIFTANSYPVAALGVYDLRVDSKIDGSLTFKSAVTLAYGGSPKIEQVSPSVGHQNQTLMVSITGTKTNFNQGSPSVIFFNSATPTSDISVQNIVINNDSNIQVEINISANAKRGYYDIAFSNDVEYYKKDQCFEVTWPLGVVSVLKNNKQVKVYPNPTTSKITIESEEQIIEKVEITDIQGRLVQTEIPEKSKSELTLSLSDFLLQNQYVLIRITTEKGVFYQKVLVQ